MGTLAPGTATPLTDALQHTRHTRTLVEGLIEQPGLLGPDFAAIHRLEPPGTSFATATRLGWRATARSAPGGDGGDLLGLLEEARRLGLVERLDWALRCHIFDVATGAGLDGELHLRPEPGTFCSPCPPRLAVSFLRGRRSLAVVAELHADAFDDERALRGAVDQMRAWGWQFCYADLTGTHAEARAIDLAATIRPAYQQLDVHHEPSRHLRDAARDVGASILAIGVDDREGLARAHEHGATWVQGELVARPTRHPR